MERESTTHGRRLDEQMKEEVDHSVDPGRDVEGLTEGPEIHEPDATSSGALSDAEIRGRSELAQHLRPSIFPADRDAVIECAREEGASPELLDALDRLPAGVEYRTTEEVWETLGGHHEVRTVETEPTTPASRRFEFRFDRLHRILGLAFGVMPGTTHVEIDHATDRFIARFGPWEVATPLSNVSTAEVSGGYFPLKTIGPAHLSLADRGLTFATNDAEGVCIRFEHPVTGIDPAGIIRHPALTVTVEDPDELVAALTR